MTKTSGGARWLRFGRWTVEVDEAVAQAAAPRSRVEKFAAVPEPVALTLCRRVLAPEGPGTPLDPLRPDAGRYLFSPDGREFWVDVPLTAHACTAALRALLAAAVLGQGGVLLHCAGVRWGERAVLALGPSGAGKSTLARLCVTHAGASLLSDETVGLLPEGALLGSPFWSDPDLVGTETSGRLGALVVLAKGACESVELLPPHQGVSALLEQCYRLEHPAGLRGALMRRVSAMVGRHPVWRFTFRKDPEAGVYLRDWVSTLR